MNRFRTKKALPSDNAATGRDTRRWRKAKKTQQEDTPKQDLAFVLPATDDFRTSLIMPNLSARFSMLRDQYDPASMMGKASDDSVLSPKRKSRLADFGFSGSNNLSFVAEVQSISSTAPRPSMTQTNASYTSADTESVDQDPASSPTSVMSRARPGEGNTLFGGRQKVVMLPTSTSTKSLGRVVCEEDMSRSTFRQKQRNTDKSSENLDDGEVSDSGSLPFGLASASTSNSRAEDAIRWTAESMPKRQPSASSSGASEGGQDTISTAGTSLASQPLASPRKPFSPTSASANPPERPSNQRRLYAQGLVQDMHDQQASAMTRMNTIQRHRAASATKSPKLGTPPSSAGQHSPNQSRRPQQATTSPKSQQNIASPVPRARSNSSPIRREGSPSNGFTVFQSAASQMRQPDTSLPMQGTTLDQSTASDDEDDIISEYAKRGNSGLVPARFKPTGLANIQEDSGVSSTNKWANKHSADSETKSRLRMHVESQDAAEHDATPKALGGLIHQHLRNTSAVSSSVMSDLARDSTGNHLRNPSGQSSVYTSAIGRDDSVPTFDDPPKSGLRPHAVLNRINNDYTNSNPWDLDELDREYSSLANHAQDSRAAGVAQSSGGTDVGADGKKIDTGSRWQADHRRELSAGTVEEREAFDREMAARQKAIQENLKAIVEVDSRGNSPQPSQNGALKAFNILKSKASSDFSGSPVAPASKRTPPLGHPAKGDMHDMQRSRAESEASIKGRAPPPRQSPVLGGPSQQQSAQMRSRSTSSSARAAGQQDRNGNHPGASPNMNSARAGPMRPNASPRPPQGFASAAHNGAPQTPRRPLHSAQEQHQPGGPQRGRANSKSANNSPADGTSAMHSPPSGGLRLMPSNSSPAPLNASFKQAASPIPKPSPMQSPPTSGAPFSPAAARVMPQAAQDYSPITKQAGALLRKKTVWKGDISEPTLISSTSNVDTVDLPPGASLKNGTETQPAIPAISRRRKLFHFSKGNKDESPEMSMVPPPPPPVNRYPNPGAPPPVPVGAAPPVASKATPKGRNGSMF